MRSFLTFGVIFISCIIAALGKPDVEKVEAATTPPPLVGMESKEVDWNQFLQDLEAQSESSERTATPPLIDMEAEEIDWSKFHEDLETQLKGAEDANEEEAAAVAMKTKAGKKTKEPKAKKTLPPKTAKAGKDTGPAIEEEAAAFDKETKAEKTSQPKAKKTSQPKAKKTSPPKKTGDTKSGKITPPATEEGTIDASTERTTSTSLSSSNTNTRVTAGLRSADADVLSMSKPSGFWLLISLASLVVVLVVVKFVWKV